ncbi:MAG: hypothetical protein AB7O62_00365 [Pirellulales bacterium]
MRRSHFFEYNFFGKNAIAASATAQGDWGKTITSTSGNGTVAGSASGLKFTMSNDNEAQNLCASFGDVLSFDIDELRWIEFAVSVDAVLAAASKLRFGLASARADDPDAIAASIFFGINGDASTTAVIAECDDGTNEVAATATGLVLPANALKRFRIDLAEGTLTQSPPSSSLGGKANVILSGEDATASRVLKRVLPNTRFNMAAYSSGLQPYMQLQKTASTNAVNAYLRQVRGEYLIR